RSLSQRMAIGTRAALCDRVGPPPGSAAPTSRSPAAVATPTRDRRPRRDRDWLPRPTAVNRRTRSPRDPPAVLPFPLSHRCSPFCKPPASPGGWLSFVEDRRQRTEDGDGKTSAQYLH